MAAVVITEEEYLSLLSRLEKVERKQKQLEQQPLSLDWLTSEQARKTIGGMSKPICKQKLTRLWKEGLIERKQIGRKVMYSLQSIRAFMNGTHLHPSTVESYINEAAAA